MYYVGIDIAKRKHVAFTLDGEGEPVGKALGISNDRDGFDKLLAHLGQLETKVAVGLEATGHYWLALYRHLVEADYEVIVLNPLQVQAYRKSGIRKRKDDRYDAFWIADYIRISHHRLSPSVQPDLIQLRELTRFRASLSHQVGDCKRKAIGILDRIFPEYETLFSNVFIQTSRQLLADALAPEEFADFDLSELSQKLQESSRGRHGQAKAREIQALAARSVGVGFLGNVLRVQMTCLLEQLALLEQQLDELDAEIEAVMARLPQYLTSIPGIGPVTGATILAEIGDVHRFTTPEKLVAYAGIDPTVFQTGEFRATNTRMSKRGSPYLRHALWQAAFAASRFDPELRAYYQRKRAEGKAHGTVLGAICRKLLHRIYIILKEERPYVIRD
ncbi:MAG: IS110 family transposase [Anaerolineae bacterium]|nr:IS110 family transposase [Anaerolineae bacterium]